MTALEQRYSIKFCVLLNKSPSETHHLITEAYGDNALSRGRVFEWHKRFREGQQEVEDEAREGRPSKATSPEMSEAVEQMIANDHRLSAKHLAATIGISKSSVLRILHEVLSMSKVCARWVPRLLTPEMKQRRVASCQELLARSFHDGLDFLKRIITGDETWLYFYDPETKQ